MSEDSFPHIPYRPAAVSPTDGLARGLAFLDELASRRSVRFFSDRPVPRALIETAIRAAGTAPSGAHQQPWTFVAISDPQLRHRIREAAEVEERAFYEGARRSEEWLEALRPLGTDWRKPYLDVAPWIVVVFAQTSGVDAAGHRHKHYYVRESVGIACGLFIAALHRMGLATLTHTPNPMAFLSEILERPAHEKPYILFPIGYPADDCTVPDLRRKPLDAIAVWRDPE